METKLPVHVKVIRPVGLEISLEFWESFWEKLLLFFVFCLFGLLLETSLRITINIDYTLSRHLCLNIWNMVICLSNIFSEFNFFITFRNSESNFSIHFFQRPTDEEIFAEIIQQKNSAIFLSFSEPNYVTRSGKVLVHLSLFF